MTGEEGGGSVHETAIVEPGAVLGEGTRVWHHSQVRAGSRIGRHCVIGKNVFIDADVRIGDRTKIQNNVSVYRGVDLADDVLVGPSVVFTNDRYPRATGGSWEVVPTVVERGVSIGGGAVIVCGVTVATWSLVGAGAVVTRSTRPHELVVGNPASTAGWACRCGRVVARGPEPPAAPLDHCPDCHGAADR